MLKVATVSPNEPYREYKDVERVYSGSTEIDKILDKNGNVLFAVNKEVEGTPALTFKGKEETNLKNYRIYGQTVDGESVGDRTGNLFDKDSNMNTHGTVGSLSIEPLTYGFPGSINEQSGTYFMDVLPGEVYTISMETTGDRLSISGLYHSTNPNDYTVSNRVVMDTIITVMITEENVPDTYTFTVPPNVVMVAIYYAFKSMPTNFQIVKGSTPLPYEPYGYKVPVTVSNDTDTLTTPIYLPEQIKMVGDEAEYIDYAEQKQHRVRVNLSEVNEFSNSITDTSDKLQIWVHQGKDQSFEYPAKSNIFFITEPTTITTRITITNGNDSIRIKHNGSKSDIVIDIVRGLSPGTYSVSFNVLNYDHTTVGGLVINNIMVNKGSTALPYEPYIENVDLDVTLPALPVLPGTNTLTVGTEVQPSNVYLKGRIKEIT